MLASNLKFFVCTLVGTLVSFSSQARTSECERTDHLVKLASARSIFVLEGERSTNGQKDFLSNLVYTLRLVQLRPDDRNAALQLLSAVPRNENEFALADGIGDSQCDAETLSDMKILSRIGETLPQNLSKSVLRVPEKMSDYLEFGIASSENPHSYFAIYAKTVCRKKHADFLAAIDRLPLQKRNWFVEHILSPRDCRAIALPEAE